MRQHEIDISGRLEVKDKPTVLAAGGELFSYSVLFSNVEKENILQLVEADELKRKRKKKRSQAEIDLRIYAVLLYFVVSKCPPDSCHVVAGATDW